MDTKPVVLIVEDLPNWQDTLKRMLSPKGYEVLAAYSLQDAKRVLCSRVIDVAIVDIRLEEGDASNTDGIAFLDEIDRYFTDDRTHAIMLSGHGTVALATQALARSSGSVLNFYEKDRLHEEVERFLADVDHCLHATLLDRDEHSCARIGAGVPRRFLDSIDVQAIVATLAPGVSSWDARKDFGVLVSQLLLGTLPLDWEEMAKSTLDVSSTDRAFHIVCWSRHLAKSFQLSVASTHGSDALRPLDVWSSSISINTTSRMTLFFSGVRFDISGPSYEDFLSVVVSK